MFFVYGFILVAVGSVAFYIYIVTANEQFKDSMTKYKHENQIIITNTQEQYKRVNTKHTGIMKANEVKK